MTSLPDPLEHGSHGQSVKRPIQLQQRDSVRVS